MVDSTPRYDEPQANRVQADGRPESLWSLGGLGSWELTKHIWREIGNDGLDNRA
jgi:hypothetical protein